MHNSPLKERVRDYITRLFLTDKDATLSDNDDLLQVLDSLQILRMVVDLEAFYAIKVDDGELTVDNLSSVDRIAAFVERKQQGLSASAAS